MKINRKSAIFIKQLVIISTISFLCFGTGCYSIEKDHPIFSNSKYNFYPDRLEAFDYYPGIYRSTDGLVITKDGDPEYTWNLGKLDKMYLQTPYPVLDAVFLMAVYETIDLIAPAGTASDQLFGDKPGGQYYWPYYYWTHGKDIREYTRDSSQHIECGDSVILDPKAAKGSLLRRCDFDKKQIREDHVVTADSIHFIPAIWMYYKITGDREFLKQCWECMWNTINYKEKTQQKKDGLWTGSPWSDGLTGFTKDEHFKNRNTSVKSLYANTMAAGAWRTLGWIAEVLGKTDESVICQQKFKRLKNAINQNLYRPEFGTYCYYKYDPTYEYFDYREDISAGLIYLYGIADAQGAIKYHRRFTPTAYGYRNVDPILHSGQTTYHGGNVWNNQECFHGWMLSKLDRPDDLKPFLFWHSREAVPLKQWREGTINPDTGELHQNYKRLVWGAMGYVSYWTRGVFGITYEPDGIRFDCCVPNDFGNSFYAVLNNFDYRDSKLRIILTGKGTNVNSVLLDGKSVNIIPTDLKGKHTIHIKMENSKNPLIPKPR